MAKSLIDMIRSHQGGADTMDGDKSGHKASSGDAAGLSHDHAVAATDAMNEFIHHVHKKDPKGALAALTTIQALIDKDENDPMEEPTHEGGPDDGPGKHAAMLLIPHG